MLEQVQERNILKFNVGFFLWCIGLPAVFFFITILTTALFSSNSMDYGFNRQAVAVFLNYYRENYLHEFFRIFLNNSLVALVMIYFTPFALFVRNAWVKRRTYDFPVSIYEKLLLFLFPTVFLTREAIRIALIVSHISGQIHKGVFLTFFGIIFPHGFPELTALGMAGAIGMEVSRRCFAKDSQKTPGLKLLFFLFYCIAAAAILEVRFTPAVFGLLMR